MTQTVIESTETLDRVRVEMARRGVTQAQVAKEADVSTATLTQLLNGSYGANPAKQLAKLERWLQAQEQAQAAPAMPPVPDWVPTPTAARVLAGLAYAQHAGDIAVIYGGAGLGKTTACRQYVRDYSSVWHATMSPATSSVAACLEEVCLALGMKNPPQGAARCQREIKRRIAGTNGLLIIDEAQSLSVQALDALRDLHDLTGIGLALVGNEAIYTNMTGGVRAIYLDRLYSRIGKRVQLRRATKQDVQTLAAALGVDPEDKAALQQLQDIGARPGALRLVVKTVRLATMIAKGAAPGSAELAAAWKDLGV